MDQSPVREPAIPTSPTPILIFSMEARLNVFRTFLSFRIPPIPQKTGKYPSVHRKVSKAQLFALNPSSCLSEDFLIASLEMLLQGWSSPGNQHRKQRNSPGTNLCACNFLSESPESISESKKSLREVFSTYISSSRNIPPLQKSISWLPSCS